MKIQVIQKMEEKNTSSIILMKEGLFWRAHELSAYYFVRNIQKYSPQKKYYKNINSELAYIGFPDTKLNDMLVKAKKQDFEIIKKGSKNIEIKGFKDDGQFVSWKESLSITTNKNKVIEKSYKIIEEIKQFPIINKTPIESQQFLIEIQNQINGHL